MAIEQKKYYKGLVMTVTLVLCCWLFGQLYEAVVYSPNWIVEPVEQVKRLDQFYMVTSARNYFEPIVPLGVLLLWILFFATKDRSIKKRLLPAFIFSILAMAVNIFIVVALLLKIFSPANWSDATLLKSLLVQWNVLNIVRIVLIGLSLYYSFQLYRLLDKNGLHLKTNYK